MVIRHASDYLPKLVEQQPENCLTLGQGPTQALGVVVEDGAGGSVQGYVAGASEGEGVDESTVQFITSQRFCKLRFSCSFGFIRD